MKQDLQIRKSFRVLATLLLLVLLPGLPEKAWSQSNWLDQLADVDVGAAGEDVTVAGNAYTVRTAKGLAWIAQVTKDKKTVAAGGNFPAKAGFEDCTIDLSGDIDLSGQNWTPIGYATAWDKVSPFKGLFNGKGHRVKGLVITAEALYGTGLFGYLDNAKIRNLGVELPEGGINITRVGGNIGGIAGYLKKSSIENCYVTGEGAITVVSNKGGTSYIGGIAGYSNSSSMTNCYSTIDIVASGEGGSDIGGIAQNGTITNCYSTAELTGKNVRGIGGAKGSCLALNPSIRTITDYARVGGGTAKLTSYASASMKVYKNDVLTTPPVHFNHGTDCYLTNNLSFLGDAYDLSGDNLPRLKMLNEDGTYFPWPTSQPADQLLKSTYLPLPGSWKDVYEAKVSKDDSPDVDVWLETTASGDIYHVRTAIGLSWINYVVSSNIAYRGYNGDPLMPEKEGFENSLVVLDKDIDFAADGMGELDWLPIGYDGSEAMSSSTGTWVSTGDFKGIFDGKFHTISNMKIEKLGDETCSVTSIYLGLFGYTRNGQIKNLTVQGSIKLDASSLPTGCGSSSTYVGGIAGCIGVNGNIVNCVSNISIEIADDTREYYVGGIAGFNGAHIDTSRPGRSSLENVCSTGAINVSAKKVYAGGITASNKGDVLNCYSTSDVEVKALAKGYDACAGGITGWNDDNSALLQYCFATGSVRITNEFPNAAYAGGICGYNGEKVKNCLALNRSESNAVSGKSVGRVAGYSSGTKGVEANSATTQMLVNGGDSSTISPQNKNGVNTYLDTYRKDLLPNPAPDNGWGNAWAFDGTNLPKLKRLNADGTSYGDVLAGQPGLLASNYLKSRSDYNTALVLPEGDTNSSMTLTYIDGLWFYHGPDGSPGLPFNGTVTSGSNPAFKGKIEIKDVPEGASPLTLDGLKAVSASDVNLIISASAKVSIQTTEKASSLNGTSCIRIESGGELTLAGNNLALIAKDKPVDGAVEAVKGLSLLEWGFKATPNATLSWLSTGENPKQGSAVLGTDRCVLAIPVAVGESYTLSVGTPNPVRQQAKLKGTSGYVVLFSAPSAGTTSYTEVKNALVVHLKERVDGGLLIAKTSDEKYFTGGIVADATVLTLGNQSLPGYTFGKYLSGTSEGNITTEVPGNTVTCNTADLYLTVSFKQTAATPPVEGTKPVETPDKPVSDPIVVDDDALPDAGISSLIRLITDDLTPENEASMETIVEESSIPFDKVVYAEIALVEITKDSNGKILTSVPIQPKEGRSVTLYCPYPAGTNSSYAFTIFHKKWDGTTETYSVAQNNLENTANGMKFSVGSFSPFAIVYTEPQTPPIDPDPVPPVYHNVVLPTVEGAVTDPVAGTYACESWSSFTFALTLAAGYDQSVPVVTTSRGETLVPRSFDGRYEINYIREEVSILISGIRPNEEIPTANADIQSAAVRVWAADGVIHIFTPEAADVRLVNFGGALLKSARVPSGDSMIQAPSGACIIILGNQRFKIVQL